MYYRTDQWRGNIQPSEKRLSVSSQGSEDGGLTSSYPPPHRSSAQPIPIPRANDHMGTQQPKTTTHSPQPDPSPNTRNRAATHYYANLPFNTLPPGGGGMNSNLPPPDPNSGRGPDFQPGQRQQSVSVHTPQRLI